MCLYVCVVCIYLHIHVCIPINIYMHVFAYFRSRNPDALNLLIKLFIERSHSLWKVPEVCTAARVAKKRYHGVSIRAYLIISFCICTYMCMYAHNHTYTHYVRQQELLTKRLLHVMFLLIHA